MVSLEYNTIIINNYTEYEKLILYERREEEVAEDVYYLLRFQL